MATEKGLEGVVVADTRLSQVDGARGRLVIAGESVEAFAPTATFESAAALVWSTAGVCADPEAALRERLGRHRLRAFEQASLLVEVLRRTDPMVGLRAGLAAFEPDAGPVGEQALAAVAAVPVLAATWWRLREGRAPLQPDPALSTAQDYLRLVSGTVAAPARVRALDTYLAAVIDHGMNASTFTARVVASTGSDSVSCLVAAICALKGPLHGGAPGPVLDMLDAVGKPENAAAWIATELAAGRRLMGFGHRVYRVRDPRVAVLEGALLELDRAGIRSARLEAARAVEAEALRALAAAHPERPMGANVELSTALLLEAIGVPRPLFTPTFAVSRSAGWMAHVFEQRATGRLIRPDSRYVGPAPVGESGGAAAT